MTRIKDASTTATSPASDDYLLLDGATNGSRKILPANVRPFRGAMVKKSADQTGANYSAGPVVAWDAEVYDTDSIHDTVTNNSRLTVPSGVSWVRLSGMLYVNLLTASQEISYYVQKNGTAPFTGWAGNRNDTDSTDVYSNFCTAPISVSPGDYFETVIFTNDTSITVSEAGSWFAMEILG